MGDDLPDLAIMQQVAFAATVPHAPERLKQIAHYCTKTPAGMVGSFGVDLIRSCLKPTPLVCWYFF